MLTRARAFGPGGALASALFRCSLAGGGLALALVLLNTLGPQRSGVFYLAFSIVSIGATLGQAGMNNLLARRMAHAQLAAAGGGASSGALIFAQALRTALMASIGIAAAVELGAPWFAADLCDEPALLRPLQLMGFAIPPLAVVLVSGEALKGLGKPLLSQLFQVGAVPFLALALVSLVAPRFGTTGAAAAYALAALAAAVASVLVTRRLLPVAGPGAARNALAAEPAAARSMLVFALTGVLGVRLGPLSAGALHSSHAVAEIEVGLRLVLIASLILVGVNSAMAPRFAALHARGQHAELEGEARASARLACALVLPFLMVVCVFRVPLLALFGLEVPGAGVLFLALAAGEAVNALTGPATLVLLMGGYERQVRDTAIAATMLNALLCFMLVPRLGALGAALGVAGGTAFLNLSSAFHCRRLFGVSTLAIGRPRALVRPEERAA